jgi:hypothetical protein
VRETEALDFVSDDGLEAVGLPAGYPLDEHGDPVPHAQCHPVGQAAYDELLPGIACRSAATRAAKSDEELAVFDRDAAIVTQIARRTFNDWYLGQ